MGAVRGGWLNSLANIMTGGSPDSERVGSTGRLGHERIVEEPEMTKEKDSQQNEMLDKENPCTPSN